MNQILKDLSNRLIEISYKEKLSHLSSCLTSLPIIYDIYSKKKDNEKFVLSNGHAGLALYVVLEHFYKIDAEYLFHKHGVHPCHSVEDKIYCSTGSLGLGLPIAIGFALATKNNVYCLISDGETFEGSIWESLNFIDNKNIKNIQVHVNINGYSAYDIVEPTILEKKLMAFLPNINIHHTNLLDYPFLEQKGMEAHYYILRNEKEKESLML